MKKRRFKRLIASFTLMLLVAAFLIPTVFTTTAYAAGTNLVGSYERDALEQADYNSLTTKLYVEQEITKWWDEEKKKESEKFLDWWDEEQKKDEAKENAKKDRENRVKLMQNMNQEIPKYVSLIKDIKDSGDFDTVGLITTMLSTASGVASCIPPYGPIVGAALNIFSSVFTAVMGGEDPPSATALMEDRMNQRFDEISDQISGLEDQIGELSNQVNESANKIIAEMSVALEIAQAQESLEEFYLSSGKDDFSYNQYRNYIYGTTKNNSSATTAYYNLLLHAQFEGASAEEVKYYYDALYSVLADNRDTFKDYIVGNATGKSIVQCYYDILSARPEYAAKTGVSAELAAMQFAYDLYQTQILADEIMLVCNNYQYTQMLLRDEDSYDYGSGKIYKSSIEGYDSLDSVYAIALLREEELSNQFAKDIAYVLNTSDDYTIENDGKFYTINTETKDGVTYGNVPLGSNVYLNVIPGYVCEMFDISPADYSYEVETYGKSNGIFKMNSQQKVVTLSYKGVPISTIYFVDASGAEFSGGSGTLDDPFLISSAYQFKQIDKTSDGMNKYYRLIDNIDFRNEELYPLGRNKLSNTSIEYKEFNGILDGNGYTISNVTITGDDYAGIFGKIGYDGVVKNLSISGFKIGVSGYRKAESSTYNNYIGIVAGDNHGIIRNCNVDSSTVELKSETSNENANRSIYFYVGGIAGQNCGLIQFVSMLQTKISVDSEHNYQGATTEANKNIVYAGGVCGYNKGNIKCAVVEESTSVTAKATTLCDHKKTVNPYATALAGGITGKTYDNDLSKIENVYSSSKTDVYAHVNNKAGSGEGNKNVVKDNKAYVPKISQDKINKIISSKDSILEAFPKVETFDVVCEDTTESYKVGDNSVNLEKVILKANGETIEFEALSFYGFDTSKASEDQLVTMLFVATIGENMQMMTAEFSVNVVDYVEDITVSGLESEYDKDASLPELVTVILHYASGLDSIVQNVPFDVANKSEITKKCGEQEFIFSYGGNDYTLSINVICPHTKNYDFSNQKLYEHIQTVTATCQNIGYDEYECLECGEKVKTNCKTITDHKLIEEGYEDSTCYAEGKIGRVYCEFCNETFGEEVKIPMKPHSIVKITDETSSYKPTATAHYCENGDHWISHKYYVTESHENGGIVYTYVCKDCGYLNEKKDTNIITASQKRQPTVFVSDGYALKGGDLVTVYVQLINNPGVYGADFGIRYDERLTLVELSDELFFKNIYEQTDKSIKFDDKAPTPDSCGYNFVWGIGKTRDKKGDLIAPNGNLLKLVFRIPENIKNTDKFLVSVVYSEGRDAGFLVDTEVCREQNVSTSLQRFMTKDGVIQLVDHLPGDVYRDGCVDILDVLYLANNFVNGRNDILESIKAYGDVDLSGDVNLTDAMILLRSLTGGYGDEGNPLYSKYHITLNTNGYDELILDSQFVDLFGTENNTYAFLDALQSVIQTRKGYKFIGWYTRLIEGERVDIDITKNISYDHDQKIQMLYAHWEKNEIVFQGYEDIYLFDGVFPTPTTQKADVELFDPSNANSLRNGKYWLKEFGYWENITDKTKQYKPGATWDIGNVVGLGKIVLKPVWNQWILDAPAVEKIGYDTNSVRWYTEKNGNYVEESSLLDDSYDFSDGVPTRLYAKWTPLTYKIEYNLNGGSHGVSHPTSVAYDKEFTVNNPTRVGYTFTGWTITGMDSSTYHLYFDSTNGDWISKIVTSLSGLMETQFKNLHSNAGTVTFTAKWTPNTYSISYSLNGGTHGSSHPTSATFDSKFTVSNPTRNGYTFAGWTISGMDSVKHTYGANTSTKTELTGVKATSFNNLRSTSGTVNFVANWKVDPYTISKYVSYTNGKATVKDTDGANTYTIYNDIYKTPQLKCGGKVIVDWTSCDAGEHNYIDAVNSTGTRYGGGNSNLDIANGITEVFFIGNPNATYVDVRIYTVGYSENSSLTIHFKDMNIVSGPEVINSWYGDKAQDVGMYLTIDCLGTNTITATSSGATAILNHKNLIITGSGSLCVIGGKGADATTAGGNGSNGGTAIIVDNLTVNMTGTLTVTGGNGGAGAKGKNQSLGTADSNPPATATTAGGAGGAGGAAVQCTVLTIGKNAKVHFVGGVGGAGGDGGDVTEAGSYSGYADLPDGGAGGNGGNGGVPINSNASINVSKASELSLVYGNGGNGGTGGNGGKAGWPDNGVKPDGKGHGGNGGKGGSGYNGGEGGKGGEGGSSFTNWSWDVWLVSKNDQIGTTGNGGEGNVGGNAMSSVVFKNGVQTFEYGKAGAGGKGGPCGGQSGDSNGKTVKWGTDNSGKVASSGTQVKCDYKFTWIN